MGVIAIVIVSNTEQTAKISIENWWKQNANHSIHPFTKHNDALNAIMRRTNTTNYLQIIKLLPYIEYHVKRFLWSIFQWVLFILQKTRNRRLSDKYWTLNWQTSTLPLKHRLRLLSFCCYTKPHAERNSVRFGTSECSIFDIWRRFYQAEVIEWQEGNDETFLKSSHLHTTQNPWNDRK